MHKEEPANTQLNCRFMYHERELKDLNLAQIYLELSNLIQASGKIQAADYCLYCYFIDENFKFSELQKCWAGMHIVGWDTGLHREVCVKDFGQLEFQRFAIPTPSSFHDLQKSYEKLVSTKERPNSSAPWRLTCEFKVTGQSFEILSYIDFFSLVK